MSVFGDSFDSKPAYGLNRRASHDRTRTAEKRRVPHVVAVLHQAIKQFAFVGTVAEGAEVALKRVR